MNNQEEELNPAPKSYRVTFSTKVAFLGIAALGVGAYGYMVVKRRATQAQFLQNNQMAAVKIMPAPLPKISVIDPKNEQPVPIVPEGQWTLLNIWATWCPPCQEEMPSLELLQKKLGAKLSIVALSADDDLNAVKEFIKVNNPSFKVLWDQDKQLPARLGISKYPETFLISPDGLLSIQFSGPRDWASPMAIDYLENAIGIQKN